MLPHLSAKEENWLRQQMDYVFFFGDQVYVEDEIPEHLTTADADWAGYRLWHGREDRGFFEHDLGFDYEFCDHDRQDGLGCHLWFCSDGFGDPDYVADLVQRFLERFRPHDCWSMSFALTSTERAVDQFGGGAIFVTAREIRWCNSRDFINERQQAFAEHREAIAEGTAERMPKSEEN
jgi:hypothetical protein